MPTKSQEKAQEKIRNSKCRVPGCEEDAHCHCWPCQRIVCKEHFRDHPPGDWGHADFKSDDSCSDKKKEPKHDNTKPLF